MAITLSKEDLANITAALASIKEAKAEVLKAKAAGIPIEAEEQALLEQETRLLALKRVYSPSRS